MTKGAVLIAAQSGRALAASARRAGYAPLVADFFGDLDTRAVAHRWRVAGSPQQGFRRTRLLAALDELAGGEATLGLVYGSGFESQPRLLSAVAKRYPLLGNSPDTVARSKDPLRFSELCRANEINHPSVAMTASPGQLVKRCGATGGTHIRLASKSMTLRPGRYAQRRVTGKPVSALFLADGEAGRLIGFSAQWQHPTPRRPYRYGGAVRPAGLSSGLAGAMARAATRLIPPLGLFGLNSADFLVQEGAFVLLEINPRPGATLDIFPDEHGQLFEHHLDACRGKLPETGSEPAGAAAAQVVYAPHNLSVPVHFVWPDWAADRQPPGTTVPADAPLCTVRAEADDPTTARALLDERTEMIIRGIPPA